MEISKNTVLQYKLALLSCSTVQYHEVMDSNFNFMFPEKMYTKIYPRLHALALSRVYSSTWKIVLVPSEMHHFTSISFICTLAKQSILLHNLCSAEQYRLHIISCIV